MDTITAQLLQTGIKISELPAASEANLTDQLEANQGGTTRRITVEQISAKVTGNFSPQMIAWLQDPTSAKLATAMVDETGMAGALVFSDHPVITNPELHGGSSDQMVLTNPQLDGGFMGSLTGDWAGNPAFTGFPTVPTIVTGSNTDQRIVNIATLINQFNLIMPGYATINSPTFTGDPKAPTPPTADNDTSIATTAFVKNVVAGISTTPSGPAGGDLAGTYPNPTLKASVALTGTPTTTAPPTSDFSTRLPTTAWVQSEIGLAIGSLPPSVPEAPFDGTTYGRQNGIWVPAGTIAVGTTPPGSPSANQLWWNTDASVGGGQMYIYYNDGSTTQWVPASASANTNTLLQTVSVQVGTTASGTTVIPLDNTIPQITEGTEFMTLAITPKSPASRLIISTQAYGNLSSTGNIVMALFRDSTANALAAINCLGNVTQPTPLALSCVTPSGSTAPTTFRVRIGPASAMTYGLNNLFGGVAASYITIQEVL